MEHKIKNKRRFLLVSNAVISVLCIVAILGFFILPLWQTEIRMKITPGLVKFVAPESTAQKESDKAYAGFRIYPKAIYVDSETEKDGGLENVSDTMMKSILDSLKEADFELSLVFGIETSSMISSVFGSAEENIGKAVDKIVDQVVNELDASITESVDKVIRTAVKEAVRNEVGKKVEQDTDEHYKFEDLLKEIGMSESRIDELVEMLISAIMDDNATVGSVTDVIMSVADEILGYLKNSEKYRDKVADVNDQSMQETRARVESSLSEYADKDGRLKFKEMLITMILQAVDDALSESGVTDDTASGKSGVKLLSSAIRTASASDEKKSGIINGSALSEIVDKFKTTLKNQLTGKVNPGLLGAASTVMTVIGVLVLINLLALAYPVIRSLTKIKSKNPGFHLALPVIFGLIPYTIVALIPNLLVKALKSSLAAELTNSISRSSMTTDQVTEILDAMSLTFTSGTVIAFVVAVILFVYSFVYGHFRRSLKKDLATAEYAQAPYGAPAASAPYGTPYAPSSPYGNPYGAAQAHNAPYAAYPQPQQTQQTQQPQQPVQEAAADQQPAEAQAQNTEPSDNGASEG